MFPFPPVWLTLEGKGDAEPPSRLKPPLWHRILWRGKPAEAFWTLAALVSMAVNIGLLVTTLLLARHLFALKVAVQNQLISGLAANFAAMDEAVIRTTVVVDDTIPVRFDLPVAFDLPVEQETTVVLSRPVTIQNAHVVYLNTGGLTIRNAPATITLPAGTALPVRLTMIVPVRTTVPVDTRIPVHLEVPVAIPLRETELHTAFQGLQNVIAPYQRLLASLPNSWEEALCRQGNRGFLCRVLLPLLQP